MATLKFNVSQLSGGVDEAPSHFSGSSDAHCSADSVHFAVLHFLDQSCEVFCVIGDAH